MAPYLTRKSNCKDRKNDAETCQRKAVETKPIIVGIASGLVSNGRDYTFDCITVHRSRLGGLYLTVVSPTCVNACAA